MSLSRVINFILRYNCTQTICFWCVDPG
jgi:hypothetical protein